MTTLLSTFFPIARLRADDAPATLKTPARGWAGAWTITLLLGLTYAVVLWLAFPASRTDIGGDYAYVSWRMAHGAVLYRDLPGYQTPLLYLIGAVLWHLWPQPDVFYAFALGTRLATLISLVALGRACRFLPIMSAAAGAIYLLLPMGFLFDAHFEPNIVITLGGVLAVLALAHLSGRRAVVSGVVCGLALMAKLTFAPLAVALAIYLLIARRRLLAPFMAAAIGTVALCIAFGLVYAGTDFIKGAFLGNAGRIFSIDNLIVSIQYLWRVEGFTILAAIAGVALAWTASHRLRQNTTQILLLWYYLAGGLSLISVTLAVGSLAPEMLAGEPAVALCAALALQQTFVTWRSRHGGTRIEARFLSKLIAPLAGLLVIIGQPLAIRIDWATVQNAASAPGLTCTVRLLRQAHQTNAAPVLVPAYTAFLARRTLVDEIVDPFNWSLRLRRGDPIARAQAVDVQQRLARGQIALVILTDGNPLPLDLQRTVWRVYHPWSACPGVHAFRP